MEYACFFGVEPGLVFCTTMPDIQIVDGRTLKDGEEGMLLHYDIWKKIKEKKNIEYKIGDKIQLNNFGTGGMKIREVPLVGIFRFPRGNQRMFAMSFLDSKSLRYLLGKNSGKQEKVEVAADATALINSDTSDVDSLFGDATPVTASAPSAAPSSSAKAASSASGTKPAVMNAGNVFDILGRQKAGRGEERRPEGPELAFHPDPRREGREYRRDDKGPQQEIRRQ